MDPLDEDRMRALVEEAVSRYRTVEALISRRLDSDDGKEALRQAERAVGEILAEARVMVLRNPWNCLLAVLGIPALAATKYMTAFQATRGRG